MMKFRLLLLLLALTVATGALAQASLSQRYASLLTPPASYLCRYADGNLTIDGRAAEEDWAQAAWTEFFQDISGEGFPTPRYATRAKMLWKEDTLYVYAEMEDPHLWSLLRQRDTIVYHDNDFEVFIDPRGEGRPYFEIEVNQRGTLFDLSLEGAYRAPRRPFIQFQWDCPGLRYAIHLDGTLNDPSDIDRGWSIEMAIPAKAFAREFEATLEEGRMLRMNFSRVQWQHEITPERTYRRAMKDGKVLPEDNWVWTPTGAVAMHQPERWGYVLLSREHGGDTPARRIAEEKRAAERFLFMLFYEQEQQWQHRRRYHRKLSQFRLTAADKALLPQGWTVRLEATSATYELIATSPAGHTFVLDESGAYFQRF